MTQINLSLTTVNNILKEKDGTDILCLYICYSVLLKEKGGKNLIPSEEETKKKIRWGVEKIRRIRKRMKDIGLIIEKQRRVKGKISKRYLYLLQNKDLSNLHQRSSLMESINEENLHERSSLMESIANANLHERSSLMESINDATHHQHLKRTKNSKKGEVTLPLLYSYTTYTHPLKEGEEVVVTNEKKITPNMFDIFWKAYPKKTDKGQALTVWLKVCNWKDRPSINQILQAIEEQKKTPRWSVKQYIPHPRTWLNQRRWLDDPKEMVLYGEEEEARIVEKDPRPDYVKAKALKVKGNP